MSSFSNASNARSLRRREGAVVAATVLNSNLSNFDDTPIPLSRTLPHNSTSSVSLSLSRRSMSALGSLAKAMSAHTSSIFRRKQIPSFISPEKGSIIMDAPLPKIIITPADSILYTSNILMEPPEVGSTVRESIIKHSRVLGREIIESVPMAPASTDFSTPTLSSDEGHTGTLSTTSGTPASQFDEPMRELNRNTSQLDTSREGLTMTDQRESQLDEAENGQNTSIDTLSSHEINQLVNGNVLYSISTHQFQGHRSKINHSGEEMQDNVDPFAQDQPVATVHFGPTIETVFRIMTQPCNE